MCGWEGFFGCSNGCTAGWWGFCFTGMIIMMIMCFFFFRAFMRRLGGSHKRSRPGSVSSSDSAGDILDKRYALGEINSEIYKEMRANLKGS